MYSRIYVACTHSYSFAMKAYTKEVENRPTAYPVRLKHFETDCFALEGSSYRDAVGIPAKKRLKPDTLATHRLFSSRIESQFMVIAGNGPSDPSQRQNSERRKCKSVSKLMQNVSSTHSYYKAQFYQLTFPMTLSIQPANHLVCPQEYHRLHKTAVVQTDKVMALLYIHSCHR